MVCSHSRAGVAPGAVPKAEATGLAPLRIGTETLERMLLGGF